MKLSIEAKVAAVAAGFMALTIGAIGQSQSSGQRPNEYAPSNNQQLTRTWASGDTLIRQTRDRAAKGSLTRVPHKTGGRTARSIKPELRANIGAQRTQQNQGIQINGPQY
jgi:hypothetical protein